MDSKVIPKPSSLPLQTSYSHLVLAYLSFLLQITSFLIDPINASEISHLEVSNTSSDDRRHWKPHKRVRFHSMFGLGDSLTDTGNMLIVMRAQNGSLPVQGRHPYGETFFHKPMGRFSDGRLLVDFLVKELEASDFLEPSFASLNQSGNGTLTQIGNGTQGSSRKLISFAVAGATALTSEYFNATFNITPYTPFSLSRQLEGLFNVSIFRHKKAPSKTLIFLGEIGGNDYNYAFGNHVPLNRIHDLVPNVIAQIRNALEMMVERGIKYVVVQSAYPMGCIPLYTRMYANATKDARGCLQDINGVVHQHNLLLSELLDNLTNYYNNTTQFVFFDSEKAFREVYIHPSRYGFSYNKQPCYDISDYFLNLPMNLTRVEACKNPSTHIIWDGPHPTEAMNKVLLNLFYTQGYVKPYPNFLTSRSRVLA